ALRNADRIARERRHLRFPEHRRDASAHRRARERRIADDGGRHASAVRERERDLAGSRRASGLLAAPRLIGRVAQRCNGRIAIERLCCLGLRLLGALARDLLGLALATRDLLLGGCLLVVLVVVRLLVSFLRVFRGSGFAALLGFFAGRRLRLFGFGWRGGLRLFFFLVGCVRRFTLVCLFGALGRCRGRFLAVVPAERRTDAHAYQQDEREAATQDAEERLLAERDRSRRRRARDGLDRSRWWLGRRRSGDQPLIVRQREERVASAQTGNAARHPERVVVQRPLGPWRGVRALCGLQRVEREEHGVFVARAGRAIVVGGAPGLRERRQADRDVDLGACALHAGEQVVALRTRSGDASSRARAAFLLRCRALVGRRDCA